MQTYRELLKSLRRLQSLQQDSNRINRKAEEKREELAAIRKEARAVTKQAAELHREITAEVCQQALNRREGIPDDLDEFCYEVEKWIKRAKRIRKEQKVVYLDGRDLDIPDMDVPGEIEPPKACYPCNVFQAVSLAIGNMRPELEDVIRARYGIHRNERQGQTPGLITYHWYIAQQLNISPSTVSRRLREAKRFLCHPCRSDPLRAAMEARPHRTICCASEYLVRSVLGAD
ncbi:hypothetical protein [Marinobacter sp. SS5-14b]|uniref:hypothetical protein n=1 Tax=Marinobacter sp. SS5-14b TaxID=3050456 RepID=UPI0026E0CF44|nr:hypothetical protein [Marinobacter sp. SS5-14b]